MFHIFPGLPVMCPLSTAFESNAPLLGRRHPPLWRSPWVLSTFEERCESWWDWTWSGSILILLHTSLTWNKATTTGWWLSHPSKNMRHNCHDKSQDMEDTQCFKPPTRKYLGPTKRASSEVVVSLDVMEVPKSYKSLDHFSIETDRFGVPVQIWSYWIIHGIIWDNLLDNMEWGPYYGIVVYWLYIG